MKPQPVATTPNAALHRLRRWSHGSDGAVRYSVTEKMKDAAVTLMTNRWARRAYVYIVPARWRNEEESLGPLSLDDPSLGLWCGLFNFFWWFTTSQLNLLLVFIIIPARGETVELTADVVLVVGVCSSTTTALVDCRHGFHHGGLISDMCRTLRLDHTECAVEALIQCHVPSKVQLFWRLRVTFQNQMPHVCGSYSKKWVVPSCEQYHGSMPY
jgi:hypothetical protein